MTDSVRTATSGKTVDRADRCPECASPLLYRMGGEVVVATFCDNYGCTRWLKENEE